MKIQRNHVKSFITKDLSEIRELMHPASHGNAMQSLAEAIVPPGQCTRRHRHHRSEEIYHILEGVGEMWLGDERFIVTKQDTICIMPGTAHAIKNTQHDTPLRFLCACSPAYADSDTEMLDD